MTKKHLIISAALIVSMLITTTACTSTPANDSSSKTSAIISAIDSSQSTSSEQESQIASESSEVVNSDASENAPDAPAAAKPGESVQNSNFKISLTSAKEYDKFTLGEGDFTYDTTPDEGKKFLVLFFEAENISSEDQHINTFYCESYLDDTKIDSEILLNDVEGMSLFTGDIAAGKKLTGYVAFQVNPDFEKLEFIYTDGVSSSSDKYNFIVTPEDLG